ncbi:hypothetical protein D1867_06615 [Acidianus infernus]|uniref:Uncharacterized protein n=1 Tax=Acidianus infernus TaxID=12915 RepID=A0A6A9QCI3_ACIIN|nr:hypothetical protein [Acidianus infernus]MUM64922.1 hypothetical protein [Acidianus infernus]
MQIYLILPYLIILSILVFTFINGIVKIILNIANTLLVYGIIINMIWSLSYVPYLIYGIKISLEKPKDVNRNLIVQIPLIIPARILLVSKFYK